MSKNRNKRTRYKIQANQPVTELTLEVDSGDDEGDLEKAGRRNSESDQARIQEILWNAEDLGGDSTLRRDGSRRQWLDGFAVPGPEAQKILGALGVDEKSELIKSVISVMDELSVNAPQALYQVLAKGNGLEPMAADLEEVAFIPITKIDAVKREVWGVAAQEIVDHAGEVFDYASSKPHFQKWSDDYAARTKGKSKGNLRAMHSPIAAGKLIQIEFDDVSKRILVGAKVVDDGEWAKVQEGVYTGFSIGGKYAKRWIDGAQMRYTAQPNETSLVDAPCIPTATFDVIKADGSTESRLFKRNQPALEKTNHTDAESMSAPDGAIEAKPALQQQAPVTLDPEGLPTSEVLAAAVNADAGPAQPVDTAVQKVNEAESWAMQLAQRVGISPKPNTQAAPEPLWKKFGDPVNMAFNCDSRLNALFTVGEFQLGKSRESYTDVEWAVIGRRVARLAEAETGLPFAYDARERGIALLDANPTWRKDGVEKMDSQMLQLVNDARQTLATALSGGDVAREAVEQAQAVLDVALSRLTPAQAEPLPTPEPAPAIEVAVGKAEDGAPIETPAQENQEELEKAKMPDTPTTPAQEPASAPAPMAFGMGYGDDYLKAKLPAFMQALSGKAVRKAFEVADRSQSTFDELFLLAQRDLLTKGGFTMKNYEDGKLNKSMNFGAGLHMGMTDEAFAKGIDSSYAPNIYLQQLVKLMLPVVNPIRSRFGSVPPQTGGQMAQWRAELGFPASFSFAQALYNTPEANVATIGSTSGAGQTMSDSALSFAAPFKRIAVNDIVSLESVYAMKGYDDPFQVALIKVLSAVLRAEEMKLLLDNSLLIAGPGTITPTASASGGSLASATYTARVTALTGIGHLLSSVAGFTGQAAQGETAAVAATGTAVTGPNGSLTITWAAVPGAVAYNVYLDNGTNNRFYGTFTIPRAVLTAMPASGSTHPTTDNTANANGFEGLLNWCARSSIYGQTIPSKIFVEPTAANRSLTVSGANSIAEFDSVLRQLFQTWNIAPTLILTSPRGAEYATKILAASTSGPYRIEASMNQGELIGGMFLGGYVNKFAPQIGGVPRTVEIMGHPYVPDGSFNFLSETIPYPQSRESRAYRVETIIPYTYWPLAANNPSYPFMVLLSEVLECFHPSAQSVIAGVDVSL